MTRRSYKTQKQQKEQSPFRTAEGCLYNYRRNLSQIETLRQELKLLESSSAVKIQNYQMRFSGGDPSCPVEVRVEKIDDMEGHIAFLERWTLPITRLIADLGSAYVLQGSENAEMLKLLQVRYLGGNSWPKTVEELDIPETTVRRRRHLLVKKAMEYLCL